MTKPPNTFTNKAEHVRLVYGTPVMRPIVTSASSN